MDQTGSQANPKKLFIGNLPWSATQQQLEELFAPHGEIVDVKLIIDRVSGRSKGIAFVEYTTEDAAQKAIEAMNGYELDGRALIVNVARPQAPREFGGPRRDFGGGGDRRGGFSRGGGGGGRFGRRD